MNIQPMAANIRGDMTVVITVMLIEEVVKTRERKLLLESILHSSHFSPEVFFLFVKHHARAIFPAFFGEKQRDKGC